MDDVESGTCWRRIQFLQEGEVRKSTARDDDDESGREGRREGAGVWGRGAR